MEDDGEQDSLFGSPPPSPQLRGRPVSPALALPSASSSRVSASTQGASASTQNVGTIALPGSQHFSELPMTPLALSLNRPVVPRPPAFPQHGQGKTQQGGPNVARPRSAPQPPKAIAPIPTSKAKKRSRSTNSSTCAEPSPRTEPEFALPDPSDPLPAHFLRNQENLLGKAGRVAGVKSATLNHVRGSTPSNPILVEDEATPLIGRQNRRQQRRSAPLVDLSQLPRPSNEEIVNVLIGQKDIFPVLESILKLVLLPGKRAPPPPLPPTGFERRQHQAVATNIHSTKRRKLNSVPAGASDWDVPYPFAEGEGPVAYTQTWEKERGKRLISELIKLVKTAATKAATKKYLTEHKDVQREGRETETRVNGYYRAETAMYGIKNDQTQPVEVLKDTSNGPGTMSLLDLPQSATSTETTSNEMGSNQSYDQLFASFSTAPLYNPNMCDMQINSANAISPSVPDPMDQKMFDMWMNLLEAFPMQFSDTFKQDSEYSNSPPPSTPTSSLRSTPGIDDLEAMTSSSSSDLYFDFSSAMPSPLTGPFDPSLFNFPSPLGSASLGVPVIPAVFPTSASGGGTLYSDPLTQTPADWQLSLPTGVDSQMLDMLPPLSTIQSPLDTGSPMDLDVASFSTDLIFDPLSSVADFSSLQGVTADKGKGKATNDVDNMLPSTLPMAGAQSTTIRYPINNGSSELQSSLCQIPASSSLPQPIVETSNMSSSRPHTISKAHQSTALAERKARKEDIVRRAKEKRQRLQEELDIVKRQLWEAALESGASGQQSTT